MSSLIYLYDNFLIYYPNVFFPTLFLIGVLGLILLGKAIILLNKNILELNKKIRRKKFSFDSPIRKNFKFVLLLTINLFFLIYKALRYFQFHVEKIIEVLENLQTKIEKILKRIAKEIFIDE